MQVQRCYLSRGKVGHQRQSAERARTTSKSQDLRSLRELAIGPVGRCITWRSVSSSETNQEDYPLHHITASVQSSSGSSPPLQVELEVDKVPISMELDTGAPYMLVNKSTFQKL